MTRDSVIPFIVLAGSILTYLAGHASYIPDVWKEVMKDGAAVSGIIAAALMASPLRHSGNQADAGFDWRKMFGR
jgi:hypothetical protein